MEYEGKDSIPVGGREGQVAHGYYLENPADEMEMEIAASQPNPAHLLPIPCHLPTGNSLLPPNFLPFHRDSEEKLLQELHRTQARLDCSARGGLEMVNSG